MMRRCRLWTKLQGMDTFIALCPLLIALIPLGMAVRTFMRSDRPETKGSTAAFYSADADPTTFPSLATLRELERTAPTFVKRSEWWTE